MSSSADGPVKDQLAGAIIIVKGDIFYVNGKERRSQGWRK